MVPEHQPLNLNESCAVLAVIENVSQNAIKFSIYDTSRMPVPTLHWNNQRVQMSYIGLGGLHLPMTQRFLLKPGEQVAIGQSRIYPHESEDKNPRPEYREGGQTSIPITDTRSGNWYQVDYELHLGETDMWKAGNNDSPRIYLPAKDEWTGSLQAGGFELRLNDNSSSDQTQTSLQK